VFVAYARFASRKTPAPAAVSVREYRPFELVEKKFITTVSDQVLNPTISFRFKLPSPKMRLGLPVGRHISLRFVDADGKMISRPYTPVTSDDELGFFELVVKIYPLGKMSRHLASLDIGKSIEVKGPLGEIAYDDNGQFTIGRTDGKVKSEQVVKVRKLGMIAGGTGLTPMLQIIKRILKRKQDRVEMTLLFANVCEPDILLRGELEKLQEDNPDRFKLYLTIDKPALPEPLPNWRGGRGFVKADLIKASGMPAPAPDTLILLCGPPLMLQFVGKELASLDYRDEHIGVFKN